MTIYILFLIIMLFSILILPILAIENNDYKSSKLLAWKYM